MITELRLEKFGKFSGKSFRFATVTLFSGRNETGKTTLFDALLDGITRPKGNTELGKTMVARYGEDRKAVPEYDDDTSHPKLSAADFLNLFAIRSGEITLEIEKNSQWMNKVKSSLFSGGIDPQSAIKKLETIISGRGQGSLNSELARIEAELSDLRGKLKEARERRKTYLDEEKHVAEKKSLIGKTEEEVRDTASDIEKLVKTIEQQDYLQKEKGLAAILKTIEESRLKKEKLDGLSRYNRERLKELRTFIEQAVRLKTEEERKRAVEQETQGQRLRLSEEKSRRETEKSRAEDRRNLAETLWERLVPREKLIKKKVLRIVRRPVLAAAAAALLAGGAGALLAASPFHKILAAVTGLVICCILLAFAFSRQSGEDTSDLEATLKTVRDRWREETGETLGESYEAVLAALERARALARVAADDYQRVVEEAASFETKAAGRARQRLEAENARQAAERDVRRFLEEAGVPDEAEYAARLATKEHLDAEYGELRKRLFAEQEAHTASSLDELQLNLRVKRDELSKKIVRTELSPREIDAKNNELREKRERLKALQRKLNELIGEVSGDEGKIQGRFEGLPKEIVVFEKTIGDRESRLAKIRLELSAAHIAKEIFEDIAGDSDAMLEELSREISSTFSTLTEGGRNVNLRSFSTKKAADTAGVMDSGGKERSGNLLSAGTRDAFLLAARLVLARKSLDPEQKAIIVLDEPFLTLDRPRTGRALAVLEEFRQKEGWQLVLFTKDEGMENQAHAVFGENLLVHRLDTEKRDMP